MRTTESGENVLPVSGDARSDKTDVPSVDTAHVTTREEDVISPEEYQNESQNILRSLLVKQNRGGTKEKTQTLLQKDADLQTSSYKRKTLVGSNEV